MPWYRISGLTVAAELPLPGAIALDAAPAEAEVRIVLRPVPENLAAPVAQGPGWQLDERRFLLALPSGARFLACDGTTLELDLPPGSDPADALPFALGTGLAALLYQRGTLVLHAATVERNGTAIALCASSGTGKSSLAAALCQQGCRLVSDDVAAVAIDPAGRPLVQPDGRCLKLCDRTIDRFGLAPYRREPVRPGIAKHYVALPQTVPASVTTGVPLRAIYVLLDHKPPHSAGIERQSPLVAAQILLNQSYRRRLALALAHRAAGLPAVTAAVVAQVPVFRLTRPRALDLLADTAAGLLDHWRGLEG
jgi:hypothetical protein